MMDSLIQNVDAIVAWHNIVGKEGVLCAAAAATSARAKHHYAPRAVDHIPYTTEKPLFVATDRPDTVHAQLEYRGAISGLNFTPIKSTYELYAYGVKSALFLPYIRLSDIKLDADIQWHRYGLPPDLTQHLKNKAIMHRWLLQVGLTQNMVNFVACNIDDIPSAGQRMLTQIKAMLDDLGMSDTYPLGLMVRGAQTDGNYGAGFLHQLHHDDLFTGAKAGQILVKRDGNATDADVYDEWGPALQALRDHIDATTNRDVEQNVVMSRFMDIDIAPGMSAILEGGKLHFMDFNGQYIAPGSSACTGTTSFDHQFRDQANPIRQAYYTQSTEMLQAICDKLFEGRADRDHINGNINIDMMVVGPKEAELWKRSEGTKWRDNANRFDDDYAPVPYDPQYSRFAEINPRETNWTLALKAVLQAEKRPITIKAMQDLAAGRDIRLLSRDHWQLSRFDDADMLRTAMLEHHQYLQSQGEGLILRMPDNPAGVIVYTRNADYARLDEILKGAAAVLEKV